MRRALAWLLVTAPFAAGWAGVAVLLIVGAGIHPADPAAACTAGIVTAAGTGATVAWIREPLAAAARQLAGRQ